MQRTAGRYELVSGSTILVVARRPAVVTRRIRVWQLKRWKVSKSSRDLHAHMTMTCPQMIGSPTDTDARRAKIDPRQCRNPRQNQQVSDPRHDLGQYFAGLSAENAHMWQQASTAPFDRDIELAVIDEDGLHALVFPCRRILSGWMKAETKERLDVRPTHWREWQERQNERHAV